MKCFIIPDSLLKEVGDIRSLKISQRIRAKRNDILAAIFKPKAVSEKQAKRLTHTCEHKTTLPGKLLLKDDLMVTTNAEAATAHKWTEVIKDFYVKFFNRNSIDGLGMDLVSSVNYDKDYNNAFWNSKQMVYGDGDGKIFLPLCNDLSVAGHEITHGVIERVCGLVYVAEPGALNESLADCFGIAIKHFHTNQISPRDARWLLGDDIVGSEFPGVALRSFKNEKAYNSDPQPKHMKNKYKGFSDNMGVHINSGIPNHAFYLMCVRLNEPSFGSPIHILYKAMHKLGKYSNFKTFAKAVVQSAEEMYGKGVAEIVKSCYQDVGIKV
jgi:Zn-dependent metalloprotease